MKKYTLIITTDVVKLINEIKSNISGRPIQDRNQFEIIHDLNYTPINLTLGTNSETITIGFLKNNHNNSEVKICTKSNKLSDIMNGISIAIAKAD